MENASKPTKANMAKGTPFKKMSGGRKVVFVCKVIVCIVTAGFVFPNVMEE